MILCIRLHSLILNENASLKRIVESDNFKEDIRQSTCRRFFIILRAGLVKLNNE